MKIEDMKEKMVVEDTWFSFRTCDEHAWGTGVVTKVLKTRVHIDFTYNKGVVYDKPHLQFLKEYNESR